MWLALDTATDRLSVAVRLPTAADGTPGVVLEEELAGARLHARSLLPIADDLLRRAGAGPAALAGVIVADGPGSFTGLRVGAAVAKALVATRGVAFRTAPSLLARAVAGVKAAAQHVRHANGEGAPVLAVSDALRGQLYGALYGFPPGRVVELLAPRVWLPGELEAAVEALGARARPAALVGDLPTPLLGRLEAWSGCTPLPAPAGAPHASALLALLDRAGGTTAPDAATWEPVYGRPAEAQAKWESTHGRPLPDPAGGAR